MFEMTMIFGTRLAILNGGDGFRVLLFTRDTALLLMAMIPARSGSTHLIHD